MNLSLRQILNVNFRIHLNYFSNLWPKGIVYDVLTSAVDGDRSTSWSGPANSTNNEARLSSGRQNQFCYKPVVNPLQVPDVQFSSIGKSLKRWRKKISSVSRFNFKTSQASKTKNKRQTNRVSNEKQGRFLNISLWWNHDILKMGHPRPLFYLFLVYSNKQFNFAPPCPIYGMSGGRKTSWDGSANNKKKFNFIQFADILCSS